MDAGVMFLAVFVCLSCRQDKDRDDGDGVGQDASAAEAGWVRPATVQGRTGRRE